MKNKNNRKKDKLTDSVLEEDKKYLSVTANGKQSCTKCHKEFYSLMEFVKHCNTKKHKEEKRKESAFGEYKFISLILDEDTLGWSLQINTKSTPLFMFLNGIEQCVEGPTNDFYLVLRGLKNSEIIGFKLDGVLEIFEELTENAYNKDEGLFTINFFFRPKRPQIKPVV